MAESKPGEEQYWVVLHFHSGAGGEVQRIIVRETRGPSPGSELPAGANATEEKQQSIQTDVAR